MIAFGLCAFVMLCAAVLAVGRRNLVHTVLWLGLALLATAGVYATLDAGFMAAIQVLLYTGGVVTLMLFAVMLTQPTLDAGSTGRLPAVLFATVVVGLVLSAIGRSPEAVAGVPSSTATKALGAVILDPLLVPFEALSMLLLLAMIGAIVLARRRDA